MVYKFKTIIDNIVFDGEAEHESGTDNTWIVEMDSRKEKVITHVEVSRGLLGAAIIRRLMKDKGRVTYFAVGDGMRTIDLTMFGGNPDA